MSGPVRTKSIIGSSTGSKLRSGCSRFYAAWWQVDSGQLFRVVNGLLLMNGSKSFSRNERFLRRCGLYLPEKPPDRPLSRTSIYTKPLFAKFYRMDPSGSPLLSAAPNKVIVGIEVTILNLCLHLYMWPPHWMAEFRSKACRTRNRMIRYFHREDGSPIRGICVPAFGLERIAADVQGDQGEGVTEKETHTEEDGRRAEERLRQLERSHNRIDSKIVERARLAPSIVEHQQKPECELYGAAVNRAAQMSLTRRWKRRPLPIQGDAIRRGSISFA